MEKENNKQEMRISDLQKSRNQTAFTSQDLLKNFYECFNVISSSKIQNKLHEPIKQKLMFLAYSIFNSDQVFSQINSSNTPIDIREFFLSKKITFTKEIDLDHIKEPLGEEYTNLQNMTLDMKLELFIQTSLQITPELQNYITTPNTKKGILQVKYPGTLKSWNNKFMILDYTKKILFIYKDIKTISPEKELKLEVYAVRWVGKAKNKYCFSLLAQNIKPKCVLLGGEQEAWVREWHEQLKKAMSQDVNNPAQNRIPSNQSNSDDEIYDDLYEIDDNAEGFKSDIESRKTKTYKVPRQKVLNSDNDDISDPEISSPFMMSFMKKREMSKQLIEFRSPKSSINPKEVFGKEIEEGKEKEEGNAAYYRNERNKDIFLSLLNNNPREIFENESSLQEFEDLRKNKQFYPPLIENLLHKVNFKDLTKEIGYRLVKSTPNMRILQNDHEPLSFKAFVTLNFDIWAILDCFLDPSQYRNWNNTVTEHKIIQNIEGLNSVIIEEKRNYQSSFYKTREFYYSRTIIPLRNMRQFILIDKSINKPNDSNAASSFWYTKGIINHNFIAILPHPKNPQSHLLILCCDIDNQGYFLTHHQNSELTLAYLSQFANLETFLSQRLFFGNHSKQEILTKYPFLNPQNENISKHLHESPKNPFLPPQKLHDFEDSIPKNEQTSQTNNLLESIVERVELDQKIQRFSSLNEDIFEEVKTSVLKPIEETQIIPKNKEKKPLGLQNTNHLLQMLKSNEHINQILKYDFVLRPRKITEEEIQLQPIDPVNGHYALSKDWSRAKEGGLLWYNKKELEVQGKVLSYLIKRMGSNLIQGKSVINISLPVDLFDIKSFLERIAYSYTYAPYFLEPSPKNLDPSSPEFERPGLYQIYQVVCFILSSMHLSINQKKPFNPILGETFQGWIKGCPIYCEQISHHPPISSFLMLGNGYKIQGNFEITASMHPNSVTGKQLGLGQVIFDLGNEKSKKIYFTFPPCVVSGLAFGSRIVNYEGKVYIFDAGEKLAMELNFNPDKKGMFSGMLSKQKTANDYFKGVVYELKEAAIDKMIKGLLAKKYSGLNFKEDLASPTEISVCEGVWHDYLEIKGKKFWELKDFQAFQLEYEDHPLPSDCLYREDLIVWRGADLEEAQKMKEKLENIQRADRKLREKIRGKKH